MKRNYIQKMIVIIKKKYEGIGRIFKAEEEFAIKILHSLHCHVQFSKQMNTGTCFQAILCIRFFCTSIDAYYTSINFIIPKIPFFKKVKMFENLVMEVYFLYILYCVIR